MRIKCIIQAERSKIQKDSTYIMHLTKEKLQDGKRMGDCMGRWWREGLTTRGEHEGILGVCKFFLDQAFSG